LVRRCKEQKHLKTDMILKKSIAYTSSWLSTLYISTILASITVFILIFLQPFDTYADNITNKNLKLIGYATCILFPILFIHILEGYWFKLNHKKWYLYQELITLFIGFILAGIISKSFATQAVFRTVIPGHNRPVFKEKKIMLIDNNTASTCEPLIDLLQ